MTSVQPQNLINQLENIFLNKKLFWSSLNKVSQKKSLGFPNYNWNEDVFIPAVIWAELLENELTPMLSVIEGFNLDDEHSKTRFLASLMTLSAWRYTQGCYTINERLFRNFYQDSTGGIISLKHIQSMKEWSVYIPCYGAMLGSFHVEGFFVHKTNITALSNNNNVNTIILTFNLSKTESSNSFIPMPFIVFDACRNGKPDEVILNFELPAQINTGEELNTAIGPYLSLFNFIFDPNTIIESDIVGTQEPQHLQVKHHYNFNAFNLANFKYSAPSNIRSWNAGLNHIVEENRLKRANPTGVITPVHWQIIDQQLTLTKIAFKP